MALTSKELAKLIDACKTLRPGPDYRVNDYVANVIDTVLDFQMHSKVVVASREHFYRNHIIRSHKGLLSIVSKFPNTKAGNLRLAQHLWGYNHWTRANFLRELLLQLDRRGIRNQTALKKWFTCADFERDVKGKFKTKKHSIGIALFHWLQLRLGVDTVKPDVHIRNFVSQTIGRQVSSIDAVTGLVAAAKKLRRKAYRLDAAIWHYQREKA